MASIFRLDNTYVHHENLAPSSYFPCNIIVKMIVHTKENKFPASNWYMGGTYMKMIAFDGTQNIHDVSIAFGTTSQTMPGTIKGSVPNSSSRKDTMPAVKMGEKRT